MQHSRKHLYKTINSPVVSPEEIDNENYFPIDFNIKCQQEVDSYFSGNSNNEISESFPFFNLDIYLFHL